MDQIPGDRALPPLGSQETKTVKNPIRAGTAAAAAAVGLVLAVAALIFTNASASEQLIDDATILQGTEATLGANDVALKALTQVVLLAEDQLLGVADDRTVSIALTEADRTIAELVAASETLQEIIADPDAVATATSEVVATSHDVVTLIESGQPGEAGQLLSGPAKGQFETLRDVVSIARDDTASRLSDAQTVTGVLVNLARYALALLIPGAAILAYRSMARRQLRFAEVELDARLEAEEEVVKAKDEFIASISHELRTPLTSIYGFSEMLLEEGFVDPEMSAELISRINTESGELTRLVEDLLTTARADAGTLSFQLSPVSIPTELEAIVVQLNRAGSSVDIDCDDAAVLADPMRIRQVLRNLMSNAQRHGGDDIRVMGRIVSGSYILAIEDDGPGVAPEIEPRLLDRFIHEGDDPLTKGSVGLGLAVVKTLVRDMNGTVRYERKDGWTRFVVTLPLADGSLLGGRDRMVLRSLPQEPSDEVA